MEAAGETKVALAGHLKGGRQYSLKTFTMIGHENMLFMLATEIKVQTFWDGGWVHRGLERERFTTFNDVTQM
jgi:hypothetical protein